MSIKVSFVALLFLFFFSCSGNAEEEKIPPLFKSSTPEDGAEDVSVTAEVSVTFDEVVELATSHGITVNGKTAGVEVDFTRLVFNISLQEGTNYQIIIPAGAVINTRGIALQQSIEFSFSTEAATEPAEIKTTLVATNPSAEAQNVYNFLRNSYGSKIISGTVANVSWNINEAEWVFEHTGKYPVLNGFDFIHLYASPATWINYEDISVIEDWWSNNGLVTIMWHWNVPVDENSDNYAFYTSETSFDVSRAVQEGTWENEVIMADLEKAAETLKMLRDKNIPVLWRPLHEAAGGWFWWGAGSAQDCKDLWHIIFNYFESQNLNNLIWVWTVEPDDDEWYPGDDYVDIITRDLYNQQTTSNIVGEFQEIQNRYPERIVALGECGSVSDISEQWQQGARWSFFMPWYDYGRTVNTDSEEFQNTTHEFASVSWWQDAFSVDAVITRDEMPDLK